MWLVIISLAIIIGSPQAGSCPRYLSMSGISVIRFTDGKINTQDPRLSIWSRKTGKRYNANQGVRVTKGCGDPCSYPRLRRPLVYPQLDGPRYPIKGGHLW